VPPIEAAVTTHGLCVSCDQRIRRESGLRPRPADAELVRSTS
jgi:hypothetical protein